jgi:rod shape-determining protein MreD
MQLALYYLLLLVLQGFLAALIAPLPAPDLFLIAVLTLLWRIQPWQLVLVAYGVGLLQDLVGHGTLGMHGLGLAGGVLLASLVRAQLNQARFFERLLVILSGLLGKWLVFSALLMWLSGSVNPLTEVFRVAPAETVFTVILGLWLLPYAETLMERTTLLRKELL